ncbi:hypothetical protein PV327_007138 [Microctonus hyperodae]|uniref:Mitochondrial genome maintenance exonuclease 1 n=1 Tax=Microctonus hyperodae TaxID=165561 RepID=A0AA39KJ60_MICHY|nr:hypothetical protein PV327_007138 [Microctonus hyperodae]
MSVRTMFKFTRTSFPAICFCSIIVQNISRNSSTKAEIIKRLMRENKKIFGPLLETKKEKASKEKSDDKISSQLNSNNENDGKYNNKSECLWSLDTVNPKLINVIKISSKPKAEKVPESLQENNNKVISTEQNLGTITKNANGNIDKNNEAIDIITSIKNSSIIHSAKSDIDKWESPTILSLSPSNDQKHYSLPGVTRILTESMSEEAKLRLENWKKRMILELGEEGFNIYKKALLDDSKKMHSLIENTLKKEPIDVPDHLQLTYKSISNILKDIKDVRFIESHVVHPTLGYRGFIDCVASYKGNLCVIDWKKSDKLKTLPAMYDSPLQISAYIGALNNDENYPFKVKTGLLAIAYAHGQPPSVFELSADRLELYWKEWLKRLEKYYTMRYSEAL